MIHKFINQLNEFEVKKYCGVYFKNENCFSDMCVREGEHQEHHWQNEIWISDEISVDAKEGEGKNIRMVPKKIRIPIRMYNFQIMLHGVMKHKKNKDPKIQDIKEAIRLTKEYAFDPAGSPINLSARFEVSYSKLLNSIAENDKDDSPLPESIQNFIKKLSQTYS